MSFLSQEWEAFADKTPSPLRFELEQTFWLVFDQISAVCWPKERDNEFV